MADRFHTKNVVRVGASVHKDASPWTRTVHSLLRFLETEGFPAPRVAGTGFDQAGRETISFIEGEVVERGAWSARGAYELGRLLRRLHQLTKRFVPPPDAQWFRWYGRELGAAAKVIGHCDAGPWNIVVREGIPVALIDWDFAGPVDPLCELAHAVWLNAKLHDDIVAAEEGLPPIGQRIEQLQAMVAGYELREADRRGLVQLMIDMAILETAAEADSAQIGPRTAARELAPVVPWAMAWRARAAGWMIRHRGALEAALR